MPLLIVHIIEEVCSGTNLPGMAKANHCDDNCEGEIRNEDQGLHRVEARSFPAVRDVAGDDRKDGREGVEHDSSDKDDEEFFTNVRHIFQICVGSDLDRMVDVALRTAQRIVILQLLQPMLVPQAEVQEVDHEHGANGELCRRPPKVHFLRSCSLHLSLSNFKKRIKYLYY